MPTATGKNARYAAISATDIHGCHGYGPSDSAAAPAGDQRRERDQRHGLATGSRTAAGPRSTIRNRCISTASSSPTSAPTQKPDRGDAEREQARVEHHRPDRPAAGQLRARRAGAARRARAAWTASSARGRIRTPKSTVPSGLPTALYPSHSATPATSASTAPTATVQRLHRGERRDDVLAVRGEGVLLGVVLEVDRELVDAELAQLGQPLEVRSRPGRGRRTGRRSRPARSRCACCRPGRARRSRSPGGP